MKLTVDDIMAAKPCDDYPRERVEELFAGRESIDYDELIALPIPAGDRWWAVVNCAITDDASRRLLACDVAETALHIYEREHPGDTRPHVAIETARRYAHGETTFDELSAAWSAACSAAWEAAWSTASYAARSAARSAASYAARAAARYAALSSACSAAWEAAREAAIDAAGAAARAAARDAAGAAARAAARAAAYDGFFEIARRYIK